MSIDIAIALNRFGLGARPSRPEKLQARDWLKRQVEQFEPKSLAIAGQPSRADIASDFASYRLDRKDRRLAKNPGDTSAGMEQIDPVKLEKAVNTLRVHYMTAAHARISQALETEADFAERLVHFWSNYFAVSVDKLSVLALAGDHEFNAIRPNIMGTFADLLIAAVTHPAMLLYLDQAQSIGPNSPAAQRVAARSGKKLGLNENLAREVLELHTLGVRTVYDQVDVTEFARALTGWTVGGMAKGPMQRLLRDNGKPGDSQFLDAIHEPGDKSLLGRRYPQEGELQARAMLNDLAIHPASARHVATKLAQHFVADVPPQSLVRRLEKAFLQSGGDLPTIYKTLIDAPEAWSPTQAKFKSPWDWVISTLRALNIREIADTRQTVSMLAQLGQPIWRPASPAGFLDISDSWAGGAALMRRAEIASRLGDRSANRVDARTLAPVIMPGQIGTVTAESIARAESPSQGLALLLLCPEFLRR